MSTDPTSPSTPDRPDAKRHRTCLLRGASIRFADRRVLDAIDLTVGPADRIAVIGDNGAGKSTLLRLVAGTLTPSAGERIIDLPRGLALAEQQPEFPPGTTVTGALDLLLADVRELEAEVIAAAEALAASATEHPTETRTVSATASPTEADLLTRYTAAVERFEARDGGLVDQRVDAALDRLALGELDRSRPVSSLSGGERARLALAAAVSAEAELLLLDEPTNDLDAAGLAWLEDHLDRHRGALVVVSHDRALLDRIATDILVIEDGGMRRYGNGYSGYLTAKEAERRRIREQHEAWVLDVARQEALLDANAFRAEAIPRKTEKASFGHGAFRARSRDHGATGRIRQAKEQLRRLLEAPAQEPIAPLRFAPGFSRSGEESLAPPELPEARTDLITVTGIRLGGRSEPGPSLELDSLTIRAGDRWLVSGPNGAGKTTLLRVLAGELVPEVGVVVRRSRPRVAWLRQDLVPASDRSLVAQFARATEMYEVDAVRRLTEFGLFRPDDLDRAVRDLSIGQRRRLDIAVALSAPSDVLFLDEPTNHLAPDLVDQFESALDDYAGAIITVTHDRRWQVNAEANGALRRIRVDSGGRVHADG